jgi:hypothetical protein
MSAKLLKRLLAVALVAAVCLTFAGQASADFVFTNTNLDANGTSAGPVPPAGPAGPPLTGVTSIGINPLRFYTNTFAGAGTTSADVRDVFAGVYASAHDNVSYSNILGPGAATTFLNIVGAVQGTADQTTGVSTLNILKGGFEILASATPLNTAAPATWTGTVVATFTLGPKVGITPGSPNPGESVQIVQDAATQNTSSINATNPSQNQGRVLFLNSTGGTPGASGFLLAGDPSAPQPPIGLWSHFGQNIEATVTAANSGLNNTTDLATMNAVFSMFTGLAKWATGIGDQGNGTSDWNPLSPTPGGLPTDFRALGEGVEQDPIAAVPEPTSIALMGMGLGGLVLAIRRRKNKDQA